MKETKTLFMHEDGLKVWCKKTEAGYILVDERGNQISKKAYAGQGGCVALAYNYTTKKAKNGLSYCGSWVNKKDEKPIKKTVTLTVKKRIVKTVPNKKVDELKAKHEKIVKNHVKTLNEIKPNNVTKYADRAAEIIHANPQLQDEQLPNLITKHGKPYSTNAALLVEVERRLLGLKPVTELKTRKAWAELGFTVYDDAKPLYATERCNVPMYDRQQVTDGKPRVIERKINSYKPNPNSKRVDQPKTATVEQPKTATVEQPKTATVEQPKQEAKQTTAVDNAIVKLTEQMTEAVAAGDFEKAEKIAHVINTLTK